MVVSGNFRVVFKSGRKTPYTAKWHAEHIATAPANKGVVVRIEKRPKKKSRSKRSIRGLINYRF